ncbi:DMT family transporter [Pseudosulfitobacter koreensis]|uniref:DMT family transporter n=1 Tax=Pseudosulfitobacter koreensis TaxID=2968472 RepID=A0ABT1Z0T7_9RHOB|nr:DMT family transporter [Pseudosulfitobacter koreense]MCR8826749.1 DMT family transporter [Pseudosulfitobacter koreense]
MDNLRGALIMVLAMLGFAIEDSFIKLLSTDLPVGQILGLLGIGGAAIFAVMVRAQDQVLFPRAALSGPVLLRNAGELLGTLGFITAIALIPLSTASAILQATPLVVTLGAALFLGDPVGWRRWTAILVGFAGVMLVIRPGLDGFDILSLFALQGVLGLAIRDLATRRVPATTSSMQLSFLAFLMLIPAGVFLLLVSGTPLVRPEPLHWLLMGGAVAFGVVSYYGIVVAMRIGEISFVTPFRYSRLVFALVISIVAFAEDVDLLTYVGATIIVASGIYTVWRERRVGRKTTAGPITPLPLRIDPSYDAAEPSTKDISQ